MNAFLKESHSSNLSSNEGIGPSDNFRRLLIAVASDKFSTSFVATKDVFGLSIFSIPCPLENKTSLERLKILIDIWINTNSSLESSNARYHSVKRAIHNFNVALSIL